jgi:LCP family protein required for cell wall assembly
VSESEPDGKQAESGREPSPETVPEDPARPEISAATPAAAASAPAPIADVDVPVEPTPAPTPTERLTDTVHRRARRRRVLKRVLVGLTVTVALCLVAGSVVVYVLYRKLEGNITTQDLTEKIGPEQERPKVVAHDAVNILMLGSDDRSGQNKQYGDIGDGTQRSDTTILLHLAADRKSSVAVSIPRDLMVDIPSCTREDGSKSRAYRDQFNHAFEIGGAACTIKTIEQMTQVRVDHHIVIDFSGFKQMVDAVDGVEVCLTEPMRDVAAKIDLAPGRQKLDGEQALGFVRARKNVDDGSDTQRMTRQQRFLAALVKKVKVGDMLTQPWKLYNLLDAGTRSITADPGLNTLEELMDLADSIKGIPNDKVAFLTVPRQPYRLDINRDELVQPKANMLFEAIRYDRVAVGAPVSGRDENGFENNGNVRIEQSAIPSTSATTHKTPGESGERESGTPTADTDRSGTPTADAESDSTTKPSGTAGTSPTAPQPSADPTTPAGGSPGATATTGASPGATAPATDKSPLVTVSGRTAEQDVCTA